jgi:hypothetical protein
MRPRLGSSPSGKKAVLVVCALSFLSGCGDMDPLVAPGDRLKVTRKWYFYLSTGIDNYVKPSPEAIALMPKDPVCSAPAGLALTRTDFTAEPSEVEWVIGDNKYNADGVKLVAVVEGLVGEDVSPGRIQVTCRLPYVEALALAHSALVSSPSGILTSFQFDVVVHPSQSAKRTALIKRAAVIIVVAVILLLLLLSGARQRQ